MTDASTYRTCKRLSLILVCAMLGACATTQRSNSGAGQKAAAPVSEPAKTTTPTPEKQNSNAAKSPEAPAPTAAASPADASQRAPEASVATVNKDETAQMKRQLAEQDEQIDKLRSDQQVGGVRDEPVANQDLAEPAKQQDQTPAAAAPESTPERQAPSVAATEVDEKIVADEKIIADEKKMKSADKTRPDDQIAVFPSNSNAVSDRASRPDSQPSAERSVYFAFDQALVAEKYDSMLMDNAAYLRAHGKITAEVQGNCDERGSREYNLALGARRAAAVKRALELAGADGKRIDTVSFGSEKPIAPGKDEDSYSKNRRADIVY